MLFWKRKRVVRCAPYSKLAEIYDFVMRHVDYPGWANYIGLLLERHGPPDPYVIDIACGTGSLAIELARKGFKVFGVDASGAMVAKAREKSERLGLDITFMQADMLGLQELGTFDAALCLYDSINYLMSLDQVAEALENIGALLPDDGIFIFDVCTEMNSMRYFLSARDSGKGRGFSYRRKAIYDPSERIQFNEFRMEFSGSDAVWEEIHRQRIYPISAIADVIEERSPFTLEGTYDGFSLRPGTEDSDRVHFVLRKSRGEAQI